MTTDRAALIDEMVAQYEELTASYGEEIARELLDLFLEDSVPRLEGLTRAVLAADVLAAQREAHSLKGAAGSLGASSLWSVCSGLEQQVGAGDWSQARNELNELQECMTEVRQHFGGAV
jgi:HPt (histidine-containing phosphotransfer) domain-containing protein